MEIPLHDQFLSSPSRSKLDSEAKTWRYAWCTGYTLKKKGSPVIIMNPFDVLCPFCLFLARLFADVLNDIAMFMEILAPHFPAFFTLIVCTAGIFKVNKNWNKLSQMWFKMETTNQVCLLQSIVGVAGGATRAALTVHQARRDNMADISAKDGSQVLFFIDFSWPMTCVFFKLFIV